MVLFGNRGNSEKFTHCLLYWKGNSEDKSHIIGKITIFVQYDCFQVLNVFGVELHVILNAV